MTNMQFTPYEYELAYALASNPELVCFDDTATYTAGMFKAPSSAWEAPEVSIDDLERTEDQSYDEMTAMADVFPVLLADHATQRRTGRPFDFSRKQDAIRIVSRCVKGVMPSSNIILVDAFPLTRQAVLAAVKRHLQRTEYAKEQNRFLWGPEIEVIDPAKE